MLIVALISTVLLLIWMGFFLMGSLPLLILKHDTPLDSSFIRGLFNAYYLATTATATLAALSYALSGRITIALALAGGAALVLAARYFFLPRMDEVRSTMTAEDGAAIRSFRLLHIGGMVLNVVLLAAFGYSMTRVTL